MNGQTSIKVKNDTFNGTEGVVYMDHSGWFIYPFLYTTLWVPLGRTNPLYSCVSFLGIPDWECSYHCSLHILYYYVRTVPRASISAEQKLHLAG